VASRSILAVELCLHFEPNVQGFLHRLVRSTGPRIGFQEKWSVYDQAARCLLANKNLWARGCWDFFDDDTRARADFNMWVHGMVSLEGARVQPSGAGDPYRGGARFTTFTMALLLVHGSASERRLAHVCDIPESQLWHAATFERILQGMRFLNFASVEGSTLYVIPRDPDFALTQEDLGHPKFQYLRPIV
jgi:hypothetical protein